MAARNDLRQLKITTTAAQLEALERVARERNVPKVVLLRQAIEHLTGVPAEFQTRKFSPRSQGLRKGWAKREGGAP